MCKSVVFQFRKKITSTSFDCSLWEYYVYLVYAAINIDDAMYSHHNTIDVLMP